MSDVILTAVGSNGSIELDDHKVVIKRPKGGCLNPFAGSGEKQVMIADITSIEYRAAEKRGFGYIQFSFVGGQESKAIGGQIGSDENSVMFGHKQARQFEALRQALEAQLVAHRSGRGSAGVQQVTGADELTKLADLRDRGAITDKEFERQKRRILGG